jgi:ribosomal-protein-alanine N-acetyltransferase
MSAVPVPPGRFSTPRLVLRRPLLVDAPRLFEAYTSDSEIVRFMSWRVHEDLATTRAFVEHCLERWASEAGFPYVIEIDGRPVGTIELRKKDAGVDFGYVIARDCWGRGYMTEALSTLVDWSLEQPGVWRASAFCDTENLASARVMEKAGMSFEGILRRYFVHPNIAPEPRDCRLYAKVRT